MRLWRPADKQVEIMLAAAAAGGTVGAAVIFVLLGAETGDALGFLGAMVGAAAAVWGAIFAERYRANSGRQTELQHVANHLLYLLGEMPPDIDALRMSGRGDELAELLYGASRATELFMEEVLKASNHLHFSERLAMRAVIENAQNLNRKASSIIDGHRTDVKLYGSAREAAGIFRTSIANAFQMISSAK